MEGVVSDPDSGKAIPYAQVAFYQEDSESPATGATTEEDGSFNIPIEAGEYRMVVSFVGYQDYEEDITVSNEGLDVGEIELSVEEEVMDEVVVKGNERKRPVMATMEGMEIKPDQNISNVGGTLLDILRNTPSVNVSDDGGVSLRGSGSTNVLIDGRNSALATDLEQIPASAIEKVEIINNPNAKYDASADGGVINIVLKRGEELGSNIRAEMTMGTRMRTNANVNLSRRTANYGIYGGYSYRSWPGVSSNQTTRTTNFDGVRDSLRQESTGERNDSEHTINYGGEYLWGDNKLKIEGVFNTETEEDLGTNLASLTNLNTNEVETAYLRDNIENEENYTYDNALIYERSFDDPDQSLKASVSTSVRNQNETQNIDIYNNQITAEGNPNRTEGGDIVEERNTSVIQVDYAMPIANGLFETGYKSIFRKFDNDYLYGLIDPQSQELNPYDSLTNSFLYQDQIHAVYAIYSDSLPRFNYAIGLRAEQTFVDSELSNIESGLVTEDERVNNQDYLNFFPSVQMAYTLNDNNLIKATYSRRIDRPNAWRLNPFPDFTDSLNVRVGDPNLQPEYINSFELGHMIEKGGFTLASNAFYRRINNQVDWIVTVEDGISYRDPRNLNTGDFYGMEFINTTEITDWWTLNASYSVFQSIIDGTNIGAEEPNRGLSWYAKATTDINLPFDINMQFTGNYMAPEIEAQGRDLARYYLDASLQRYFLDKQLNISASFRDIFDIRNFRGENNGPGFEQSFSRKWETRIVLLTASYNFKSE